MSDDRHPPTPDERAPLDALPRELPPADLLEERVVAALRSEGLLRSPAGGTRRADPTAAPRPHRPRPAAAWWAAAIAAGLALFLGGYTVGQGRGSDRAVELVEAVRRADAADRAALVQRAGSMYVRVLAALAEEETGPDGPGGEVALAALRGAILELSRLHPDDGRLARIREILDDDAGPGGGARQTIWF